jgi:hypothetical protein
MDWRSTEGIRLLHAAFPHGYLPAKGHTTLGGYVCVYGDGDSQAKYIDPSRVQRGGFNVNDPIHARWFLDDKPDALLPDPDPTDVATWALLKAELARRGPFTGEVAISTDYDLDPTRALIWRKDAYYWQLMDWRGTSHWYDDIKTHDPAEALVRALAHCLRTPKETTP